MLVTPGLRVATLIVTALPLSLLSRGLRPRGADVGHGDDRRRQHRRLHPHDDNGHRAETSNGALASRWGSRVLLRDHRGECARVGTRASAKSAQGYMRVPSHIFRSHSNTHRCRARREIVSDLSGHPSGAPRSVGRMVRQGTLLRPRWDGAPTRRGLPGADAPRRTSGSRWCSTAVMLLRTTAANVAYALVRRRQPSCVARSRGPWALAHRPARRPREATAAARSRARSCSRPEVLFSTSRPRVSIPPPQAVKTSCASRGSGVKIGMATHVSGRRGLAGNIVVLSRGRLVERAEAARSSMPGDNGTAAFLRGDLAFEKKQQCSAALFFSRVRAALCSAVSLRKIDRRRLDHLDAEFRPFRVTSCRA